MAKIYTKNGDFGETGLFGGKRVNKSHPLILAIGEIDELSSLLGLTLSLKNLGNLPPNKTYGRKLSAVLILIQRDLFLIGSYLSGFRVRKGEDFSPYLSLRTGFFEGLIDLLDKKLPELRNFILPGGTTESSFLHLARVVTRRAERAVVGLGQTSIWLMAYGGKGKKSGNGEFLAIVKYLNRLSDLLFVLARWVNYKEGKKERVWKRE